jgi:hypothetical protein
LIALSGGFGYLGSAFILGNSGNITVGGMTLNKNIALAIYCAAAAAVANVGKDYIIPKIPIQGNISCNSTNSRKIKTSKCTLRKV